MRQILGRYVLREVVTSWIVVTGVLLLILLGNQVAAVLERAAVSQYPQGVVLELIYLGVLQYLSLFMPVGLLLGIVFAFGRLYHDSEMAAALACGVGPGTLYFPVIALGVLAAAGVAAITLVVAPQATAQALVLRNAAERAGQFAPLAPGVFRAFGGGSAVVYAERVDPDGTLENVFFERNVGRAVEVAVAHRAVHTLSPHGTTQTITLYDGERFEGVPGSAAFRTLRFSELTNPVRVPPAKSAVTDLDAQPTAALIASSKPRAQAQLAWRIALPVMCIVLTVLALPLSRLEPRQGRYARIWLAVVVYLVYANLMSAGKTWIAHGTLPPALGLWWTHVVVGLLAVAAIFGPSAAHRLRYRPTPA